MKRPPPSPPLFPSPRLSRSGLVVLGAAALPRRPLTLPLLPLPFARDDIADARLALAGADVLALAVVEAELVLVERDRKSTRLNSSHANISYAVFCLKKKKKS